MAGSIALLVPVFALICVVIVTVSVQPRRRRLVAIDERTYPQLADLRRTAQGARLVSILLGLGLAVFTASLGSLGRGLMLAPIVFAAVLVVGALVGDLLSRGAARSPGSPSAGLERRRVLDYLPRGLSLAVAVATTTLAGLLFAGWATASTDDAGRAGRMLARCTADGSTCAGAGPYPGSFYAIPLLVAVAAVLMLAAVALVVAVGRPRGADPEVVRVDDVIRRRVAESIVAALGVGVGVALCGVAQTMALPLLATSLDLLVPQLAGWACLAASLAGIALAVWSVSCLIVPGATPARVDPARPRQAEVA